MQGGKHNDLSRTRPWRPWARGRTDGAIGTFPAAASSMLPVGRRGPPPAVDPAGLTLPIAGVRSWVEWGGVIKVDF